MVEILRFFNFLLSFFIPRPSQDLEPQGHISMANGFNFSFFLVSGLYWYNFSSTNIFLICCLSSHPVFSKMDEYYRLGNFQHIDYTYN